MPTSKAELRVKCVAEEEELPVGAGGVEDEDPADVDPPAADVIAVAPEVAVAELAPLVDAAAEEEVKDEAVELKEAFPLFE